MFSETCVSYIYYCVLSTSVSVGFTRDENSKINQIKIIKDQLMFVIKHVGDNITRTDCY